VTEDDLHRNARRVRDALAAAGSTATVRVLEDSARTAAEAASALGVEVGQIAKTLVFTLDGAPVVAVLSGDHRLDPERLAAQLGGGRVERANADTVRTATGYPIGGVSPVDLPHDLRTLVDIGLRRFDVVWAAAGTPHAVFATSYAELLTLTRGEPADVSTRP
jgi:Cys-tRNA(Pro) deacylase